MPRFLAVCLVPCLLAAACSTNPASPAQFPAAAEAAEASEATWQAGHKADGKKTRHRDHPED